VLQNLIIKAVLKALEDSVKSGQLGKLLSELLLQLLSGKQALTFEGPESKTQNNFVMQFVVSLLRDLIKSGKLNEFLLSLLEAANTGAKISLPLLAEGSAAGDVEISPDGKQLVFTSIDGNEWRLPLN
jgi:hypothetical protein